MRILTLGLPLVCLSLLGQANADGNPAKKYKDRATKKTGVYQMVIVSPGDEPLEVTVPVYIDGYLVSGTVQGLVASGYQPGAYLGNAVVNGMNYPIPMADVSMSPSGYTPAGWEMICQKQWYFNDVPTRSAYQFKMIYHHGYNTTTDWWSALEFSSMGYMGRVVNHFGPHDANQGGQYVLMTGPVSELPLSYHPAGTQVYYKGNNGWWPDYGQSYLEGVQCYESTPTQTVNKTMTFSQFYEYDTIQASSPVAVSLPGIGLLDYGCNFVDGTVTVSNVSITKTTNYSTETTWITRQELIDDFGGSLTRFKAEMSSLLSTKAPSPDKFPAMAPKYLSNGFTGAVVEIGDKSCISVTPTIAQ